MYMNVQKRLVNTSLKVAKLVIVVGGLFVQQQRPISKAGRILSDISESGLPPPTPCAQNDQINVLAIGASQFRGNYLPLLQKLLPAHKVVLYSPSPFNKNTHPHPLIFLRGSMHQKSESVRREVI